MSHILRHAHHLDAEKMTTSSMRGWLLAAMLVLAVIFALSSLREPAQDLPISSATATVPAAKSLLQDGLAPGQAPTEPALRQEDLDMTSLRPHGG